MPRSSPRKRQVVNYNEDLDHTKPTRNGVAGKAIAKVKQVVSKEVQEVKEVVSKVTGKRKADPEPRAEAQVAAPRVVKKRKKKGKEDDAMPLAKRTGVASLKKGMYIGAHVSGAGGLSSQNKRWRSMVIADPSLLGVQNAVTNAVHIGANAFALFLKSQRKWTNPALDPEAKNQFINLCKHHSYSSAEHALPHGSYLVNLAQADETKATQAYTSFLDDLERCEQLGIKLYNFHPGSTGGDTKAAAVGRIAAQLNKSHKATKTVITVLENMAGSGNVVGSTWEDLRDIIALVEDKKRVGVCIDTCHAFAAGYDLRTPEAFKKTIDAFNDTVGAEYLKAFHCKLG